MNPVLPIEPAPSLEDAPPTKRSRLLLAAGLVAFLALAFLLFEGAWRRPTAVTIGAGQDRGLFMFFIRWVQYAVYHGHNPFVTTHLNHPAGVNLMWNTSEVLPSLVFAPITAAFGAAVTFNLLMTLGVGLSAWCSALAIHRFVKSWTASWIGGLLYGFSPYMIAQSIGHLHTVIAFLPPLILVLVHEITVRQRWRPAATGILLGLALTAQLLIGEELLAISAIIVAVTLVYLAIFYRNRIREHLSYILRAVTVAVVVFLVTAAWPLWVQFFGPQRVHGVIQARDKFGSDLLGFVIPTKFQWLAPHWAAARSDHFSGGLTEHIAYLGIPLLAFLAWTIVRSWRRPVVRAAAFVGVVMAVLSMGMHLRIGGHKYHILLPWAVGAATPVLNNVVASRLILGVFMMAALMLALGVEDIFSSGGRARRLIAGVVVAVALISLFPRLPFPTSPLPRSTFFGSAQAASALPDGAVVLELPVSYGPRNGGGPTIWHEQAGDRFARLGGYFLGPTPPGPSDALVRAFYHVDQLISLGRAVPPLTGAARSTIIGLFHSAGIQFVVVGPSSTQDGLTAYVQSILQRAPQRMGDADLWQLSG